MTVLDQLAAVNPVRSENVAELTPQLPPLRIPPALRSARRSRIVLAGAAFGLSAVAVGSALAVTTNTFESLSSFLSSSAPQQARSAVAAITQSAVVTHRFGPPSAIELAVSANGPDGQVSVYRLQFAGGAVGSVMVDVSNATPHVDGATIGSQEEMTPASGLTVHNSFVGKPATSPVYFSGSVASNVVSVELLSADGETHPVDVANGEMIGWISPSASSAGYTDAELIARNASGVTVGRVDACGSPTDVDFRAHSSTMPDDVSAACVLPPTPDH